jgi:hypothetical protein
MGRPTPADLILVNKDGKIVDGGASERPLNAAGEILFCVLLSEK